MRDLYDIYITNGHNSEANTSDILSVLHILASVVESQQELIEALCVQVTQLTEGQEE